MLDLTGSNLAAYILSICRDVVSANPRFRQTLGDVSVVANNRISFGDAQVVIKNITASGTRLSPDYFMKVERGRAVAAKSGGHPGIFLEWVKQSDPTLIDPGVYYLNVDSVDERTKNVQFTTKKFKWREGNVTGTTGSWVYLRNGIDPTTVTVTDADTPSNTVEFVAAQGKILLQTPVVHVAVSVNGSPLVPYTDYWLLTSQTRTLGQTIGGTQQFFIPSGEWKNIAVVDDTGYTLRPGLDYSFTPPNAIKTAAWNPPGYTLSVTGLVKSDPRTTNAIQPENFLDFQLLEGETLVPNQMFVTTASEDHISLVANPDGTVQLPFLLGPGDFIHYEVRIDTGPEQTVTVQKRSITDQLVSGFVIAIGDQVVVGDQIAIIVSPQVCECYDVYGSKDNVQFSMDVKANDMSTSSEIAELIKKALLIHKRNFMEQDGVSILEAARDMQGESRDESGTATRYISTLNVVALCDWEVWVPLVTRVTGIDIQESAYVTYPSKLLVAPVIREFGTSQFMISEPGIVEYSPDLIFSVNGIPVTRY